MPFIYMPDIFRICPKVFQNIHIRPKHTYYNKKEKEVTAYVRLLLDHPSAPLLRQQQFRPHRMQPEMPCRAWTLIRRRMQHRLQLHIRL